MKHFMIYRGQMDVATLMLGEMKLRKETHPGNDPALIKAAQLIWSECFGQPRLSGAKRSRRRHVFQAVFGKSVCVTLLIDSCLLICSKLVAPR